LNARARIEAQPVTNGCPACRDHVESLRHILPYKRGLCARHQELWQRADEADRAREAKQKEKSGNGEPQEKSPSKGEVPQCH
jgi:hypothetical protein